MPNAFRHPIIFKLCWHNWLKPRVSYVVHAYVQLYQLSMCQCVCANHAVCGTCYHCNGDLIMECTFVPFSVGMTV